MADDELERILSGEPAPEPAPSVEEPKPQTVVPQEPKQDPELLAKEAKKADLDRAISEAQAQLSSIRKDKRKARTQTQAIEDEEDELPQINLNDPSAKAWDKHIKESVQPMQADLEKSRSEIRSYALRKFLESKPALSKNQDKVKELMETYDKIRTASESTVEGVLLDLDKSYGAVFHDELVKAAQTRRVQQTQEDILFSDSAVSSGAGSYDSDSEEKATPVLNAEQRGILAKWGMTPQEWVDMKKKHG